MAEQADAAVEAPAKSGSLMGKLMIAGFMALVVAVECVLAFMFIPSAEDVAVLAEQRLAKKLPADLKTDELGEADEDGTSIVEVELGEYSVTVTDPNSTTSQRVDFVLVGTVRDDDQKELQAEYDRSVNRFRDQILYEIRNSDRNDFADPSLGLIKRRILEKSNDLFGQPLLRSILIPQFSFVEQ